MTRRSREYVKIAVPQKELTLRLDRQILKGGRRQRTCDAVLRGRATDCERKNQRLPTLILDGRRLDKGCAGQRGHAIHVFCDGLIPEIRKYRLTGGGRSLRYWRGSESSG